MLAAAELVARLPQRKRALQRIAIEVAQIMAVAVNDHRADPLVRLGAKLAAQRQAQRAARADRVRIVKRMPSQAISLKPLSRTHSASPSRAARARSKSSSHHGEQIAGAVVLPKRCCFWSDRFRLFGNNRGWADRDRLPRTQRGCHSDMGNAKTR
jgi:hypothetical protein